MFAVNSLTDRILQVAATEGTVERCIKEEACPQGHRATAWPSFMSNSSPHDGSLAYELSQYLRITRTVLQGSLGMRIESKGFWDDERRWLCVTLFEIHEAADVAHQRKVEIARAIHRLTTQLAAEVSTPRPTPIRVREVA